MGGCACLNGDAAEGPHAGANIVTIPGVSSDETIPATPPRNRRPREGEEETTTGPGLDVGGSVESAGLDRGSLIGRYVVLSRLGSGGMGVVLAAYDPDLDRKIALKLLKPMASDEGRARSRLLREAQALARLSHPHVVAVHDVGMHAGQVFIAMEFVAGQTLAAWMKGAPDGRPRPWREVVSIFKAAGLGLAAAHAVGMVHRDFKPGNVMVDEGGRIRVMDFGLARTEEEPTPVTSELAGLKVGEPQGVVSPLTQTGAVLGTPAYMSSEQMWGDPTTAKSDQFSYCVALYEALYGERPFAGKTLVQLATAVKQGDFRDPPAGVDVPAWLAKIVRRGLAREPDDRFPSMEALLAALDAGEARRVRGRRVGVVLGLAAVVAGGWGYQRVEHSGRVAACTKQGDVIDELWNPGSREALRAGILATGVSNAPVTVEKLMPWMDQQAEAWREHATEACMRAEVDETWDQARYERAKWCLEDRRLELSTAVEELARADDKVVQQAVHIASGFSRVELCTDEEALAGMGEPPPVELRPRLQAVREDLSRVRYLDYAGSYAEGIEVAQATRERAEELGWRPLVATARGGEGMLLWRLGRFPESEAAFIDAYMEGVRTEAWDEAARAAIMLSDIVGTRQARHDEGEVWVRHARVAIAHARDPQDLFEATLLNKHATLCVTRGDFQCARNNSERALSIWEESLGPDHARMADAYNSLANLYYLEGDYELARSYQERLLATREATLGAEHPAVAIGLHNLGNTLVSIGDYEQALSLFERALHLRKTTFGPDNVAVAESLNTLGMVHYSMGDYEEANGWYEQALTIWRRELGDDHPRVAMVLNNLGNVRQSRGEYEEAIGFYERGSAIWVGKFGPEHPNVADSLNNLGLMQQRLGNFEEARSLYARALAMRETLLGSDHPDLAYELTGLGAVLGELGDYEPALEHLERAVAIRTGPNASAEHLAFSRFALARVLWKAPEARGGDRPRARMLAQQARATYGAAGKGQARKHADVQAWLDAHPL